MFNYRNHILPPLTAFRHLELHLTQQNLSKNHHQHVLLIPPWPREILNPYLLIYSNYKYQWATHEAGCLSSEVYGRTVSIPDRPTSTHIVPRTLYCHFKQVWFYNLVFCFSFFIYQMGSTAIELVHCRQASKCSPDINICAYHSPLVQNSQGYQLLIIISLTNP